MFAGTLNSNPDANALGLPSVAATSGRGLPIVPLVRNVPPSPAFPEYTWTVSKPAQPCAVRSATQPATTSGLLMAGTTLAVGASINPSQTQSGPVAVGPGSHTAAGVGTAVGSTGAAAAGSVA